MPRPSMPPTPAASTDIKGREYTFTAQSHNAFQLPPSAIASRSNSSASHEVTDHSPTSPQSPRAHAQDDAASRKRSHAQSISAGGDMNLPPPPSRSRKIIQVKPKEQQAKRQSVDDADYEPGSKPPGTPSGGKKKGATSSQGRKIARKTAHSLIERRRRSKMNEEFGVLKDLIPACRGHEMHKLAILQASIDYLRYLENCVSDLKANGGQHSHTLTTPEQLSRAGSGDDPVLHTPSEDEDEDEVDEDEQMTDDTPAPALKKQAQGHKASHSSVSAAANSRSPAFPHFPGPYRDQRHYSQASSEAPSPFFGAQSRGDWYNNRPQSQSSYPPSPATHSNQTSPMLLPQGHGHNPSSDLDREASAALLMLNASDRRTSMSQPTRALADARVPGGMKGISVKDLLSN